MTAVGPRRPVILALDSAGSGCSVAVAAGDAVLSADRAAGLHGQAETLFPMVDRAMRQAGLSPATLDIVAVTVGPGSFTGIRAGLAAARGIALATGARLAGVTSFAAVAAGLGQTEGPKASVLLVALESRREDLYVQLFDCFCGPVGAPAAVMPVALGGVVDAAIGSAPLLLAGDAAHRAALVLSGRPGTTIVENTVPEAVGALRAATRRLPQLGAPGDTARPLYLRPPDVTLSAGHPKPILGRA